MDEKNLQNKHSTLLKRQKLLLNEKLIFTHYFNRVSEEERKRSFTFEDYLRERLKDEKKISLLDIGKKYDVVHSELQNAHIKWENFEKKKDENGQPTEEDAEFYSFTGSKILIDQAMNDFTIEDLPCPTVIQEFMGKNGQTFVKFT